jgi:NAD(P)-dependent dehydrogenase (short-subunit alcohol dehydrogenase family)
MKLQNKVALITGAGSGIGQEAAVLFAKEGATIIATDINAKGLKATESLLENESTESLFLNSDVSKDNEVQTLMHASAKSFGKIDILYNNAGVFDDEDTTVTELSEIVWDRVMAVNLKSMFFTCKYAIPIMLRNGGGSIINTSSIGGIKSSSVYSAYAASKAGVIGLTRNIAKQYAPSIRANSISPGDVDTPMLSQVYSKFDKPQTKSVSPSMLKRSAHPSEIANLSLFLASNDSSYITAANIVIDGGITS